MTTITTHNYQNTANDCLARLNKVETLLGKENHNCFNFSLQLRLIEKQVNEIAKEKLLHPEAQLKFDETIAKCRTEINIIQEKHKAVDLLRQKPKDENNQSKVSSASHSPSTSTNLSFWPNNEQNYVNDANKCLTDLNIIEFDLENENHKCIDIVSKLGYITHQIKHIPENLLFKNNEAQDTFTNVINKCNDKIQVINEKHAKKHKGENNQSEVSSILHSPSTSFTNSSKSTIADECNKILFSLKTKEELTNEFFKKYPQAHMASSPSSNNRSNSSVTTTSFSASTSSRKPLSINEQNHLDSANETLKDLNKIDAQLSDTDHNCQEITTRLKFIIFQLDPTQISENLFTNSQAQEIFNKIINDCRSKAQIIHKKHKEMHKVADLHLLRQNPKVENNQSIVSSTSDSSSTPFTSSSKSELMTDEPDKEHPFAKIRIEYVYNTSFPKQELNEFLEKYPELTKYSTPSSNSSSDSSMST